MLLIMLRHSSTLKSDQKEKCNSALKHFQLFSFVFFEEFGWTGNQGLSFDKPCIPITHIHKTSNKYTHTLYVTEGYCTS